MAHQHAGRQRQHKAGVYLGILMFVLALLDIVSCRHCVADHMLAVRDCASCRPCFVFARLEYEIADVTSTLVMMSYRCAITAIHCDGVFSRVKLVNQLDIYVTTRGIDLTSFSCHNAACRLSQGD